MIPIILIKPISPIQPMLSITQKPPISRVFGKKSKKIAFFFVWGLGILKKMIIIYG